MKEGPGFTSQDFDLQAAGHRLRARRFLPPGPGREDLPTLVFLHEGLGSIAQWRAFPAALAEAVGLPALLYDRYGYGASQARTGPQDPDYLELEAQERLPAVLAACGITKPFLVGHSDGATIALLYAARFPSHPLGVIAEAAHVFVEEAALEGIRAALDAYGTTSLRDQLRRHHGEKVDAVFHGWSGVWLSPEFRPWSMVDQLGAITAPLLAIQGEEDEYATPAQLEVLVRGVAGPARGLAIPCGHAPHLQARDAVLGAMARFVAEVLGLPLLMAP
jgi:pimeloyl-ACP methyl ester carboxylesterase